MNDNTTTDNDVNMDSDNISTHKDTGTNGSHSDGSSNSGTTDNPENSLTDTNNNINTDNLEGKPTGTEVTDSSPQNGLTENLGENTANVPENVNDSTTTDNNANMDSDNISTHEETGTNGSHSGGSSNSGTTDSPENSLTDTNNDINTDNLEDKPTGTEVTGSSPQNGVTENSDENTANVPENVNDSTTTDNANMDSDNFVNTEGDGSDQMGLADEPTTPLEGLTEISPIPPSFIENRGVLDTPTSEGKIPTNAFETEDINFANNSSNLTTESESYLDEIANYILAISGFSQVQIHGHTDAVGSAAYNQGLSERRAQSVVDYLINNTEIGKDQIIAIGHGESLLKIDTQKSEKRNRRVEFVILKGE